MHPMLWLALALAVIACGLGGGALVLALRSTPHSLARKVEDVYQIAVRAEQRADKSISEGAATREHCEGLLEEIEETHKRVETKRKRAESAAARAEEAQEQPQLDEWGTALQRARASGFRV